MLRATVPLDRVPPSGLPLRAGPGTLPPRKRQEAPAVPSRPAPRPAVPSVERIFRSLGIGKETLLRAGRLAERRGTAIEDELIAAGALCAEAYHEALASLLGVRFLRAIDPASVIVTPSLDTLLAHPHLPLRIDAGSGRTLTVLAPRERELDHLMRFLAAHPDLRAAFAVASPATVRGAVWLARGRPRVEEAMRGLSEVAPVLSARTVFTGLQGFVAGAAVATYVFCLAIFTSTTVLATHMALTVLFAACIWLRAVAAFRWRPPAYRRIASLDAPGLPVYTIAVPLKDEARVVGQLVEALDALSWPRSRLDIKLICEEDDAETLAAVRALALRPEYEIVLVPRQKPLTKPKALAYAMAGARGAFVVIYDAEDRPHPEQLLEAYARFVAVGPDLACIQAPLVVSNPRRSWLTSLFAMEYCGLFRCMLPFLARAGLPLPLGGTSNHIRMEAMRHIGGWDPFNVTEDADLGLRLARHGYRFGVISRPTFEDAPAAWDVWLKQRSRWFKGWLQTWLVIMRRPLALVRECGLHGFLTFQIMTVGMVASALTHPLMLLFLVSSLHGWLTGAISSATPLRQALAFADLVNIGGTYLVFMLLCYRAMTVKEKLLIGKRWLLLPAYWLLMSAAAWRAAILLLRKPFEWEKTPHEPVARTLEARPATASAAPPARPSGGA